MGDRTVKWDDTTYLHEAALRRGLGCTVAANGTLVVTQPGDNRTVCLAQGVLPATGQATAALLSEQDLVRQLLRGHGIPVPEGRVYRFAEGTSSIADSAGKLGFPLVVRPAWVVRRSPTPARAIPVTDQQDLIDAVTKLLAVAGHRARRPALPHARLIIDRRMAETELHALVIGDEVVSVGQGPPGRPPVRGVEPAALDAGLRSTMLAAVRAIPELPAASVTLAVAEPAGSGGCPSHAVVGLEIYPRLFWQEQATAGAASRLATAILEYALTGQLAGAHHPEDPATIRLQVGGLTNLASGLDQLNGSLADNGITGALRLESVPEGTVQGEVAGLPERIAQFTRSLFDPSAGHARPLFVVCERSG